MKVAVLDLGTVFAKFFKSSVSPKSPGPTNNPFSQGSNEGSSSGSTVPSLAGKTPFLLLSSPPSPLHSLNTPTASTSSLSRIPSGKALTPSPYSSGISAPSSPAHSVKPQPSNSVSSSLAQLKQLNEDSWTNPAHTASSSPVTILVRPAPTSITTMTPAMQSNHSSRSPRLLQETSVSGWNTKSMLFTLPDIGEESTDYEDNLSHGKGLSRGNADPRLSDNGGDPLPVHFTRPVQEAIHNYICESVSSLSSSGQTTPTDLNNSWSGIQSYTTGLSTERSSVYSWRDDEFDKANTQRVHHLFWDVDEMLFEGSITSQNKNLQAECKDWTKRSLHLRILGKQLIFPKDEGFQHFQGRNSSSSSLSSSTGSKSINEHSSSLRQLCVSGSMLVPTVSPLQRTDESTSSTSSLGSETSVYSFLEEEIYDVEGTIEEYLAYDSREHDDEGLDQKRTQLHQKRTKRGIPPVSPNDCIKDTVAAEVFDDTWRTIVGSIQELLIKTWEIASVSVVIKQAGKIHHSANHYLQLPVPRLTSETTVVPPSRGSEARSSSYGAYIFTPQTIRNLGSDLNGVMTIQAKPLQHRHAGLVEKTHEQEDKSLPAMPRVLNSARNRLGRSSDNSIFSSSRLLHTPSRKTPTQRRLPALTLDPMRSKTPNVYSDEVLRGTKLYTGLDRLSSPSIQTSRNKLPPINSVETVEQHLSVPGSRHSANRTKQPHSRVSSAVPDTTGRRPLREKTVVIEQFSRPNTTHTFRSETSHRRSFTPLDFANHTWTGHSFLTSSQYQPKSFQRNPPNSRRKFPVPS
ncbi:protein FAM149A isoform X1 [Bufo bufo]|uniref:protein FAM149A isoform X1 n=1 Tax=Bufo bufo TaxID=8384 RepID=UPI001ABE0864|nr:protein FAM149A isoform X1 [Bufo bufo]